MKKTNQHILLFIFLISSFFIQGQEISITPKDLLAKQINELKANRDFITKSNCNQVDKEPIVKEYQADFNKLMESLALAQHLLSISSAIKADKNTFNNAIANNEGVDKLTNEGIIGKSQIPQVNFVFEGKTIEAHYRNKGKGNPSLISLEINYPDNIQVYLDFTTFYQAMFHVYKKETYSNGEQHLIKRLHLMFDPFKIGKINYLFVFDNEVERYRLRLDKYRYETYCYDANEKWITATQTGNDIAIKPNTYLLWYKGTIGKHPIKMMLKWQFVKENNDVIVNDNRVTDVLYAYDSKKKWISLHDLREPQGAILGEEKDKNFPELDAANWNVPFEMNTTLKGVWNNLRGTILPITLTPITKEFPNFIFKANIEEELTPSGTVANKIVRGLSIYKNDTLIQELKNEYGSSLDYFKLGYVDINYDGYLDLFINDKFYLYNPTTKKFRVNNEDDYYPYLAEIGQYNLYNKSFISQMNRSMLEYRAVDGKLNPFHSSSYYPNKNGDMVMLEEKYVNGKWITISEDIEKMEDEELVKDDDVDIGSQVNYKLVVDMSIYNKSISFSPNFYNKTGKNLAFKQDAKLYVNLIDINGKSHQQYLYNTNINDEGKLMLDDNYILYNGKEYFLSNWDGVLPFFPTNIDNNSSYTFRLELKHPLFGSIFSDKIPLHLPLAIERKNIIHLNGSINNKVLGDLYAEIETKNDIRATFINSKTDQRIKLKGTLKGIILNLEEYEKDDTLSGYFEGEYNNGIYKGYWISPDRETRVPFEFKKQ